MWGMASEHDTLQRLDTALARVQKRVGDIQEELEAAEQEMERLRIAREVVRQIAGLGAPEAAEQPQRGPRYVTRSPEAPDARNHRPRRIRSANVVAELVRELGGAHTKDEIFDAFMTRGLAPESWSNPRNAFNNAINRAVARGLLMYDDFSARYRAPEATMNS